ncbi:MAG: glycosyltransferase family 2 protein [Prevotella sp.]|nr:glycosyltransferase family 2 protein [Prevotella sp.]
MRVSIIVPIYNVAPYIERCLHSIESQTYHDIECILVDDCGKDDSMHIAEQFIQHYKGDIRFCIIRHQQNQGLSAARNTGMKTATGEYIYFIDSDDTITPDCIETLVDLAKKYPNADYVQGDTVTGSELLNVGDIDADVPEYCTEKQLLEKIILSKTHRTAWNRLIKRSFLIDNSLFFPVGLLMEDHYWTYFVSKQVHAVSFTHKGTYFYYKNKDSIINSPSKASYIKRYSSYMTITGVLINDMLQRDDIQPWHRIYVGEAIVFCLLNLARLRSLRHWWKFWKFTWRIAYKLRTRFTWRRFLLFICMMPPICMMMGINGWRWRIQQYVIMNL